MKMQSMEAIEELWRLRNPMLIDAPLTRRARGLLARHTERVANALEYPSSAPNLTLEVRAHVRNAVGISLVGRNVVVLPCNQFGNEHEGPRRTECSTRWSRRLGALVEPVRWRAAPHERSEIERVLVVCREDIASAPRGNVALRIEVANTTVAAYRLVIVGALLCQPRLVDVGEQSLALAERCAVWESEDACRFAAFVRHVVWSPERLRYVEAP
jgi:hypothetical protein